MSNYLFGKHSLWCKFWSFLDLCKYEKPGGVTPAPQPPVPPTPPTPPVPPIPPVIPTVKPPRNRDLHITMGFYSIMESDGDKEACLKKAGEYADSIRIMVQHDPWGKHVKDWTWTPEAALGKCKPYPDQPLETPYWSIMQWNEAWWAEFARIIKLIGQHVGRVHVSNIEWGCANKQGWIKTLWPFRALVEKFGNPPNFADEQSRPHGGIVDPLYQQWHQRFQHRLIAELKATGVPFDYETINEFGLGGNFKSYSEEYMKKWYKWLLDDAKTQGLPAGTKIIGNGGVSREFTASLSDIFAVHAISGASDVVDFGLPPEKVELSLDGGYQGHGDEDYKGRKNPTIPEMKAIVQVAKKRGYSRFEGFSFATEGPGQWDGQASTVVANLNLTNHQLFSSIVDAWNSK